jgi:uncharacterized membrane protein
MKNLEKGLPEKYFGFLFHYYRAEVYRETVWRNRLDVSTNWAIVVTAAILSFVFSNPQINHVVVIVNYVIVWFFLYIESRRFRYYGIVRDWARIFERHILAPILRQEDKDLAEAQNKLNELADSLERPKIKMSRVESLSWRVRRNYIFILPLIFLFWVYKVIYDVGFSATVNISNAAKVGFIPGWFVISAMVSSQIFIVLLTFYFPRRYGRDDLP